MQRALIFLLLVVNLPVFGQAGHYWTQNYGTRSILLSNSAIGGVQDLGALYYNPGRLGLIENPAFLLNADVYEWSRITFDDAVGEGASKSRSDFGGVPGYAAGTFKLGFLKGHSFGYSILQRNNTDLNFAYREEVYGDVLENFPGEEFFGANIDFRTKSSEQWYSLTWSYPFSKKFSVGLTTTAARVSINKGTLIELQALTSENKVAQYQFDRNFSLKQYGFLWKVGLAGELDHMMWGLTITTPMVKLTGNGSYNYEEFFSGIEDQSETADRFTTSRQNGLEAMYKRPLSIGAGLTFPFNRSSLHVSTEWYSGIKRYSMLEATPHISQSDGDTITFNLIEDLKGVINVGIGGEVYFSEKVTGYASFSTDFSAAPDEARGFTRNEPIANNTVFTANFYHFAGGVVLSFRKVDLTLGGAYTGAKQTFSRPVDFPEEGDDGIFDQDETGTFSWKRFRIVFSFSFPFLDDLGKKLDGNNNDE